MQTKIDIVYLFNNKRRQVYSPLDAATKAETLVVYSADIYYLDFILLQWNVVNSCTVIKSKYTSLSQFLPIRPVVNLKFCE